MQSFLKWQSTCTREISGMLAYPVFTARRCPSVVHAMWPCKLVRLAEWLACLTAVWEDQGSNHAASSCVYCDSRCDIQPWAHGLRTFNAVPRSTQPSTIRGTAKWVPAYRLSNNNNGDSGWHWMVAANFRRTHSPSRLASLRVGGHLALSLHVYPSDEPGELSQWLWSWW